jgi:hypothetical protein
MPLPLAWTRICRLLQEHTYKTHKGVITFDEIFFVLVNKCKMEQIQLRNEVIRLVNMKNKINLIVYDLLQWV